MWLKEQKLSYQRRNPQWQETWRVILEERHFRYWAICLLPPQSVWNSYLFDSNLSVDSCYLSCRSIAHEARLWRNTTLHNHLASSQLLHWRAPVKATATGDLSVSYKPFRFTQWKQLPYRTLDRNINIPQVCHLAKCILTIINNNKLGNEWYFAHVSKFHTNPCKWNIRERTRTAIRKTTHKRWRGGGDWRS